MAKSIRSKQKRRMRAIKRVRYGEKELKRLVEMVKKAEEKQEIQASPANDNEKFSNSMEIDELSKSFIPTKPMETDQNERNKKTMLDKYGQYPEWMNSRRLKKQKTIVKRLKKKKSKV